MVYVGGVGVLQLHVADGQGYGDGGVFLNGATILQAGPNFQGNTVPPTVGQPVEFGSPQGGLWDIRSFTIPSGVLGTGTPNNLTLTSPSDADCLSVVVMLVSVPHSAPPIIIGENLGSPDSVRISPAPAADDPRNRQ